MNTNQNNNSHSTGELQSNPEHNKNNKISVSEVGHAKNVANFEELIVSCQSFDTEYNPVNDLIKIPQLQSLHIAAQQSIDKVHSFRSTLIIKTNQRQTEFSDLKPLATRIINALIASGADKLAVNDAKTINRKIQGKPSTPKTNENEPGQETKRAISTSQQSYDKQIDHFSSIIELLSQIPQYTPNEVELQITSLRAKLEQMQTVNTQHINDYTDLSKILIERNHTLYNPLTGLVAIAKLVKQYVKSVFGAKSPQYRQISDIQFRKVK